MAAYLPVLKAILPYLAPLVSATLPMFTKSAKDSGAEQSLQDKQISELQAAVKTNAESLQTMATQLQQTIAAFDEREASDQNNYASIKASVVEAIEQQRILKSALEKSIKDAQVTKYLSLAAITGCIFVLAFLLLKFAGA